MQSASNATAKPAMIAVVPRNSNAFRDIIVPIVKHANAPATNAYALSVAGMFGSSVTGLAFVFNPVIPVTSAFDALPINLIEELAAQNEADARESAGAFERQAQAEKADATIRVVHAGFSESEEHFAESARSFDLAVAPQYSADDPELPNFIEAALFQSGRPVLAVPYIHKKKFSLARVLIAWDGSRASARAVSDAWPLLERAGSLYVVTAGKDERTASIQQSLQEHLSKHGLNARFDVIGAAGIDAGNAILSHAADLQADLLVIGGYGHSKLREWVLGGVTRTVLETMTLPVLLSH